MTDHERAGQWRSTAASAEERVEALRRSGKATASPGEIRDVLGYGSPYAFNIMAKQGTLPWAFYFSGRNLRIMVPSFLRWWDGVQKEAAG